MVPSRFAIGMSACTLALLAPLVSAQAGGRAFDRFDGDGDGIISHEEFLAVRAAAFDRLDGDGNGVLTQSEVDAAREQSRERIRERLAKRGLQGTGFENADSNGDGEVSREEWMSAPSAVFDRADANGDSAITRDEMGALREQVHAMRVAQ